MSILGTIIYIHTKHYEWPSGTRIHRLRVPYHYRYRSMILADTFGRFLIFCGVKAKWDDHLHICDMINAHVYYSTSSPFPHFHNPIGRQLDTTEESSCSSNMLSEGESLPILQAWTIPWYHNSKISSTRESNPVPLDLQPSMFTIRTTR